MARDTAGTCRILGFLFFGCSVAPIKLPIFVLSKLTLDSSPKYSPHPRLARSGSETGKNTTFSPSKTTQPMKQKLS